MSNVSPNKKYLNLDEIRISYRVKDDSIHITSDDEDLTDSGFHLTLGKHTESEQIIRKLLIEKGLIRPAAPDNIPSYAPLNMNSNTPSNEFILGLSEDGNVVWDANLYANAFILGNSRSLPTLTRNLFAHCLTHNSEWQFYGIDVNQVESKEYRKFNETVNSIATNFHDGIKMIDKLVTEMNTRYSLMSSQSVNTYVELEKPERKILFVLDEATIFMDKLLQGSQEIRKHVLEQFTALLKLGHMVGIHVVLSTQRIDVVFFPEAMRSYFTVRIAAERLDAMPSVLLLGSSAATRLPKNSKGRGLFAADGVEKVLQTFSSTSQTLVDWVIADKGKAEPTLYQLLKNK